MRSVSLWTPEFDGLYTTQKGETLPIASDFHSLASYWAATEWYPVVVGSIVVASFVTLLAAYEFLVHVPTEVIIWWRLIQRRRAPTLQRSITPYAILWLRYTTLALGITFGIASWSSTQSISSCSSVIWPLQSAFIAVVLMSTAAVNSWRSRTITKAAIQSRVRHALLRSLCAFFILARLAALIVMFIYQRKTYSYFHLLTDGGFPAPVSTCTSLTTAIAHSVAHSTDATTSDEFQNGNNTIIGLFATLVASDFACAVVTLASIFRLSQSIQSRSSVIASLFNNSIMFYSMLVIFDLACLVYFTITSDGDLVGVATVISAVLTVRGLINEQETILAANVYSHTHYTRRRARMDTLARTTQRNAHASQAPQRHLGDTVNEHAHGMQQPAAILRRAARAADLPANDDCDACYLRGPIVGVGGRHWQREPVSRHGAGLTDIERVSVIEAGHSIDRPWPQWDDDDDMDDRERRTGERSGIHTFIRDWWRNVESVAHPPMPSRTGQIGVRTCDAGMEGRATDEPGSGKGTGMGILSRTRSRPNTIDTCNYLAAVPGQSFGAMNRAADLVDEKESVNISTESSDGEQGLDGQRLSSTIEGTQEPPSPVDSLPLRAKGLP